ncbi:hypothetical protein D3C76_677990 [compost metagenome]
MNRHTDYETANQVNKQNDDTGNGIPFDEFTRPVHRTIEIGFTLDFTAAFPSLLLINQPSVQVSVNTHLLTWHGVECKASGNLSHTLRTFSDYDKLDHYQDQEDNKTDYGLALGYPCAKCCDNVPGFGLSQNELSSRYVKR